jgi:hypothetical protein
MVVAGAADVGVIGQQLALASRSGRLLVEPMLEAVMGRQIEIGPVKTRLVPVGAGDATLGLSGTSCAGTPPMKASARTCEPIQSGSVWVRLASA